MLSPALTKLKSFHTFLARLIEQENEETILRATVNTFVTDQLTEKESKEGLKSFYNELDHIFNLQFGKILLALSSSSQLKTMKNQSVPYFNSLNSHIQDCEERKDCTGAIDLINELGRTCYEVIFLYFFCIHLYLQSCNVCRSKSCSFEHSPPSSCG